MPRGGLRPGAGGTPTWNTGKTKVIRVPEALADELLRLARILDEGGELVDKAATFDAVTGSKEIDLSKVSVTHSGGEIAVRLQDLVRLGYRIKPDNLAKMVAARIRRKR